MTDPQFTVVIPAFDSERTVAAAVGSALSQTVADVEVVVVDDGSKDDTADVARRIADRRVRVISQPNRGPAAARNAAIAVAHGRYVTFLDSDDLLLPRYLERAGTALAAAIDPGFAYTDAYVVDAVSGRVRTQSAMDLMRPPTPGCDRDQFLLELLLRNFVYVSTAVPRRVLEAIGGYDESRFGTEDYDLWLRIILAGHEPISVPGRNAVYRQGPGQISTNSAAMSRDVMELFAALSIEAMPTEAHREALRRRRRETQRELRIAEGRAPIAGRARRIRDTAGRARQRIGMGVTWYERAPDEVAAALRAAPASVE